MAKDKIEFILLMFSAMGNILVRLMAGGMSKSEKDDIDIVQRMLNKCTQLLLEIKNEL